MRNSKQFQKKFAHLAVSPFLTFCLKKLYLAEINFFDTNYPDLHHLQGYANCQTNLASTHIRNLCGDF